MKALKGPMHLVTYVSLTCTNCPDVVQALNAMATLNPAITHEMVDGALYQDEVDALKIQGVPSVFADGKLLHVGRGEFGELLAKLEEQYGIDDTKAMNEVKEYDVIVKLGEQKVETIKQYHEQLGKHSAGEVVTVTAMRKGAEGYAEMTFDVTLGEV